MPLDQRTVTAKRRAWLADFRSAPMDRWQGRRHGSRGSRCGCYVTY
jgi:hypothetical protein